MEAACPVLSCLSLSLSLSLLSRCHDVEERYCAVKWLDCARALSSLFRYSNLLRKDHTL